MAKRQALAPHQMRSSPAASRSRAPTQGRQVLLAPAVKALAGKQRLQQAAAATQKLLLMRTLQEKTALVVLVQLR